MTAESPANKHFFAKIPRLSSKRILLRGVELHEAGDIIDIAVYDGVFAANQAEAVDILTRINADIANGESIHWGIFIKETNQIGGTCGYYRGYAGNSGEVGYILKSDFRGLGLMTEAIKLVVQFGFETLRLEKVVAYTDPNNFASMAVLQRAGFIEIKNADVDRKFIISHPSE
jgi:[ribosomal protein S5]-alanine N-acetyltransferase